MELMSHDKLLKAVTTGDFAHGGQITRPQQRQFLHFLLGYSQMMKAGITVKTVDVAAGEIDKMWLHDPILESAATVFSDGSVAQGEGGGSGNVSATMAQLYDVQRHKFGKLFYNCNKVVARAAWSTDSLRENIEGRSLERRLRDDILGRLATDFEDLAINGNTSILESGGVAAPTSPRGKMLKIDQGWDIQSEAATSLDLAGEFVSRGMWTDAIRAIPRWRLRDGQRQIKWWFNTEVEQDWMFHLAARATPAGDAALQGNMPKNILGVPYQIVDLIPSTKSLSVGEATSGIINGQRHGPFTCTKSSGVGNGADNLVLDIDNAGAVTINLATDAAAAGVLIAGTLATGDKFTLTTPEVVAIINKKLAATIAFHDPIMDRITLKSTTTGAASEVEVQVGAGANAAATADLLGLGNDAGGDGLFNDINTEAGAAAGANTVFEGTFIWLGDARHFNWIVVTADPGTNAQGIRSYSEFNKDRDRTEMVIYGWVDQIIDEVQGIVKIKNLRVQRRVK